MSLFQVKLNGSGTYEIIPQSHVTSRAICGDYIDEVIKEELFKRDDELRKSIEEAPDGVKREFMNTIRELKKSVFQLDEGFIQFDRNEDECFDLKVSRSVIVERVRPLFSQSIGGCVEETFGRLGREKINPNDNGEAVIIQLTGGCSLIPLFRDIVEYKLEEYVNFRYRVMNQLNCKESVGYGCAVYATASLLPTPSITVAPHPIEVYNIDNHMAQLPSRASSEAEEKHKTKVAKPNKKTDSQQKKKETEEEAKNEDRKPR